MEIQLKDKNALVCGGSRGIGRAVAELFAALGATVTLLARDEETLNTVKKNLATPNQQQHRILALDSSHPKQLEQSIQAYVRDFAPIHILINNTGGPNPGPAHNASTDAYTQAFQQHLLANQILVQNLLLGMQKEGFGRIINIISTSVKQPIPNLGVSNTIRGAVANWSKTLASELGPFGITVNNVLPGATETERLQQIFTNKATAKQSTVEAIATAEKAAIPLQRFAQPEEIAYAVAFLASPYAAYINGINLPVDGGRTQCL